MKKKLSVLAAFFGLFSLSMQAQDFGSGDRIFKKFKVDVSLGYAVPQETSGPGKKAGIIFAVEPKYAVMDELSVGLRMEGAAMANVDMIGETGNVKANASYLATGDYYFSNNKFRPFGGIGAGVFSYASVDIDDSTSISTDNIPVSSKFGFMARAGFEYGHLRFGIEYNFIADKNGYLGIKLGAVIGGGRK
ncbi:MAG: hypothetical protein ABI288_06265 [Ginsengibacter sp.]